MARPAGLEPTTPWFEARCSIQLSYGRPTTDYRDLPVLRQKRNTAGMKDQEDQTLVRPCMYLTKKPNTARRGVLRHAGLLGVLAVGMS